jgi:dynein intermediate chain 1, axonemal
VRLSLSPACAGQRQRAARAGDGVDDSKELRNQFNFSERAAQTSALHPKDKGTITDPPPTIEITGTCCQSAIYDEYVKDHERAEAAERATKLKAAAKKARALRRTRRDLWARPC